MKPLIVLLVAFGISLLLTKAFLPDATIALCGRIAMSAMLCFTAMGHFLYSRGMALMLPEVIPFRTGWVYLTGVIEAAAAIGLLINGMKALTGWMLIIFFILVLPANIYAAMRHLDYQSGSFNGKGLSYLWFRIPLQALFIAWTYLSAVK